MPAKNDFPPTRSVPLPGCLRVKMLRLAILGGLS